MDARHELYLDSKIDLRNIINQFTTKFHLYPPMTSATEKQAIHINKGTNILCPQGGFVEATLKMGLCGEAPLTLMCHSLGETHFQFPNYVHVDSDTKHI